MSLNHHVALAALAALVGACELPGPGQDGAPRCQADDDCPSGLQCATGDGWCYDPTPITRPLAVQLIPPTGTPQVTDQRASVVLWGDNQFSAAMAPAVVVEGLIHDGTNKIPHSIAATVSATTPGDVPGTTLRSDATSGQGLLEGGVGFTLAVIPDRQYVVSINPDDTRRPPVHLLRKFTTDAHALDVTLPGLHEYPVVCGFLTDGADRDKDGSPDALVGVRVQAVEVRPEGADTTLPLRTSSVAVTTPGASTDTERRCADGEVELRFPQEPGDYVLQVEPAAPDPAQPDLEPALIPKLTVDPALWTIQVKGEVGEVVPNLQTILVAPPESVHATIRVRGKEAGGATVPLPGATVMLKGSVELGGVFTAHGETNADGVWAGDVLPGAYIVTVNPVVGAHHARTAESIELGADGVDATVLAPRRARVNGIVVGYDERRLANTTIRGVRLSEGGTSQEPVTALTDDDGRYELWLDPGPWGIVVIPTAGSGYPRQVDRGMAALASGDKVAHDFVVPAPRLVRGAITDSTGQPVAGVTVEFYDLQVEDDGDENTPAAGLDQLRLLGHGTTDAEGAYRALLSPVFE